MKYRLLSRGRTMGGFYRITGDFGGRHGVLVSNIRTVTEALRELHKLVSKEEIKYESGISYYNDRESRRNQL